MSDTFADPRSRAFSSRPGRNVRFADDNRNKDSGRSINIVHDNQDIEKENGKYPNKVTFFIRHT